MDRMLKRKSSMTSRKKYVRKARMQPKKRFAGNAGIVRVVNKMLKRKIETKQSTSTTTDDTEIFHNNFQYLDTANTMLSLSSGTGDPMTGTGNRIGDEVTLKSKWQHDELQKLHDELLKLQNSGRFQVRMNQKKQNEHKLMVKERNNLRHIFPKMSSHVRVSASSVSSASEV